MKERIIYLSILIIFFTAIAITEDAFTENQSKPAYQNTQYALTKTSNEPKNNAQEQQKTPNQSPTYGGMASEQKSIKATNPEPHEKDTNSTATHPKKQPEKSFWARLWEDPTATVTMALVVATCLLACFSLFQALLFRRELILTQRPKLHIRNIMITNPIEMEKPIEGRLIIANVGGTPAKKINVGCWAERKMEGRRRLPGERPYEGKNPNYPISVQLKPGESYSLEFRDQRTLVGEAIISRGQLGSIYVMGYVEYIDGIGTPRRTAFCRQYQGSEDRFSTVPDPDYEYEE